MKLQLINDVSTLKSTDNATQIELAIVDEQQQFIDLAQFKNIEVLIGSGGTLYLTEIPVIHTDTNTFAFTLSNALPVATYQVQVHLTTDDDKLHIAPNKGAETLTIEKSFNEVGETIVVMTIQQLLDDMAATLEIAEQANAKSDSAVTKANTAVSTANTAKSTADTAKSTADTAKTTATNAVTTANTANTTASDAKTIAQQANTTANSANTKSDNAVSTSNSANTTAQSANTKADNAVTTANNAKTTADKVRADFDTLTANNTDAELITARTDETNTTHASLKKRIDSEAVKREDGDAIALQSAKNYTDSKVGGIDFSTFATTTEVSTKVDKVTGKGLSTNDYSGEDMTQVASLKAVFDKLQKMKITNDNGSAIYTIGTALPTVVKGVFYCTATNSGTYAAPKNSVEGLLIAESSTYWNFIGFSDDGTMLVATFGSTWKGWKTYEQFTSDEKTKLAGIADGVTNTTLSDSTSTASSTTAASSTAVKTVNDSLTTHSNLSASTSAKGHVQLTSSTSSTSTTLAATASAVKVAYDLATTAKTSADSATAEIANARTTANGATYSTLKERLDAMSRTLPKVYGIKIDTTNSNPATALTYVDDATGFAPAKMDSATDTFDYGSWADKYPFNAIKPCLVKNGQVVGYLNPNDYSKFVNGISADITSGDSGDVMVEFPKIYWKFETIGTDLYIRYSKEQVDGDYKCLAHMRANTVKDKVYISAYLGFSLSSKLRSLNGKTPTTSQTIGAFRTLAQANGSGYDQTAYYQLLMLQVLYIVMFKDRDSQTALGRGYVAGSSAKASTGNLNNKGLFYGETTGKVQMKFCGIEDFYGNLFYFVDGIFSDSSYNILINNQSFNDTGANYTNYGQGATADLAGHINSVQGGNETGFIAKATSGSATTHYPDYGYLNASCIADFGGSWASASNAGAFTLRLCNSASYSSLAIGARLMFC